jgi:hypothetical protein
MTDREYYATLAAWVVRQVAIALFVIGGALALTFVFSLLHWAVVVNALVLLGGVFLAGMLLYDADPPRSVTPRPRVDD